MVKRVVRKRAPHFDPIDSRLASSDAANRLVICQIRVALPNGLWSREISKKHPEAIFDITNWIEWNAGTNLAVLRVYNADGCDCVGELQKLDGVVSVVNSKAEGSAEEIHIVHKTPPFSPLFKKFGVMQKTPIRINNGVSTWEIVGSASSIQKLLQALRKMMVSFASDPLYRNPETLEQLVPEGGKPIVALPSSPAGDDAGHYIVCKLRCTLPRPYWHSEMSRRHPEASVDVLGYSILQGEMLVDLRVHTNDLASWGDELRGFEDISDVKILGRPDAGSTLRVTYKDYNIQATMQRLHLIVRTPFSVKNGIAEMVMAGPEDGIRRFISMFPGLKAEVEAVYSSEKGGAALLTPRQAEVFHRAMAAGYFEVPRRVTLTELAARLGVAVSSLSEMLAVVEKKLLQDTQSAGTL
jgi:hypothetical protein